MKSLAENNSAWTSAVHQPLENNYQKKSFIGEGKRRRMPVDPPDGGWGWFVTLALFLCCFIMTSMRISFSVIFPELLKEFGMGAGSTSWVTSVELAFSLILGPFVAALSKNFGNRNVAVGGAVLGFISLTSSVFCSNLNSLTITYGVLTGIANCATVITSLNVVGRYFRVKHPIAQGIGGSGIGIGMFLMPPLAQFLNSSFGWRGTLLIVSGLSLHTLVAACLLRPLYLKSDEELQHLDTFHGVSQPLTLNQSRRISESDMQEHLKLTTEERSSENVREDHSNCSRVTSILYCMKLNVYQNFDLHLFKNWLYVLTIISFLFVGMGSNITLVFVYTHAINIGIGDFQASFLLSAFGIFFILSAIVQGFALHHFFTNLNRAYALLFSWLVQGTSLIILGFTRNYAIMVICTSLEGFARALTVALNVVVIKQVVGEKYFTSGVGMSIPFFGIGQLIGPPISGYLYDSIGKYDLSFCVSGCSVLLGFLILAPGHIFHQKTKKNVIFENELNMPMSGS